MKIIKFLIKRFDNFFDGMAVGICISYVIFSACILGVLVTSKAASIQSDSVILLVTLALQTVFSIFAIKPVMERMKK